MKKMQKGAALASAGDAMRIALERRRSTQNQGTQMLQLKHTYDNSPRKRPHMAKSEQAAKCRTAPCLGASKPHAEMSPLNPSQGPMANDSEIILAQTRSLAY